MSFDQLGLLEGFARSSTHLSDRPAIHWGSETVCYGELDSNVRVLAKAMIDHAEEGEPPLSAVLSEKTPTAYVGILATLARGHGYVPLSPAVPVARNAGILEQLGVRTLIVDEASASQLPALLGAVGHRMTVLMPESDDASLLARQFPDHRFVARSEFPSKGLESYVPPMGDVAYVLFTSGSTGKPKGVQVSHANIRHFLATVQDLYGIGPDDRLTQWFDLVFDLSLFDLFAAWQAGASVCCPLAGDVFAPAEYIARCQPTVWFSVPSTIVLMDRLRLLDEARFPSIRLSLFCGEALTVDAVRRWSAAVPGTTIENLYGPTELTLACTRYRWSEDDADQHFENGVVPIGEPLVGMVPAFLDANGQEVAAGEIGELAMAGPQVALGYHQDPERTSASFVHLEDREGIYYRTGDRVRKPTPGEPIIYLGRNDHQIKIRGHRVELGEVEHALREAAGVTRAIAVGWPVHAAGADGIIAFVETQASEIKTLRQSLEQRLPKHMLPADIVRVDELPHNSNGKVDRRRLILDYEEKRARGPKSIRRFTAKSNPETTPHAPSA